MATTAKKVELRKYPLRKECTVCGRKRATTPVDVEKRRAGKFRILVSGYLQGRCIDCERDAERERWHTRSPESKLEAGGAALRRRRARAA